jgi:hypothetical protein
VTAPLAAALVAFALVAGAARADVPEPVLGALRAKHPEPGR